MTKDHQYDLFPQNEIIFKTGRDKVPLSCFSHNVFCFPPRNLLNSKLFAAEASISICVISFVCARQSGDCSETEPTECRLDDILVGESQMESENKVGFVGEL